MSQDPILRTRLFIPPFKPEYLHRPQLIYQINSGIQNRLVFISAPAGYGKTTLIAEWIAQNEIPVAWLSLDHSINTPITFLKYLIASLQTILPDIGQGIQELLTSLPMSPIKTLAYTFVNEICEQDREITLVLDDFHCIQNSETIHFLDEIIQNQPPGLHLLIASRSELPLSYSRMLARGEMTTLGIDDLRFKPQEVNLYLKSRLGENISIAEQKILNEKTEGWIAGLQMAVLSIRSGKTLYDEIDSFTGENRYIADYLMNEVLQNQKAIIQQFLIQTSILDRLNASLCERVTGLKNCQNILDYLEYNGLFLIPLDDQRIWYRYHPMFAELLYSRLKNQPFPVLADLHHRAAGWFESHAFEEETVRHWLAAQEYMRVVVYLQSRLHGIMATGNWSALLNWLEQIPDHYLVRSPILLAHQVFLLWEMGLLEQHNHKLELLKKVLGPVPADPASLDTDALECACVLLNIKSMKLSVEHNFDAARLLDEYARLAKFLPQQFPFWRAMTTGAVGFLNQVNSNFTQAIAKYAQATELAKESGMILPLFMYTNATAILYWSTGHIQKAFDTCAPLIELDARQNQSIPFSGISYGVMGELCYLRGDLSTASEYIRRAIYLIGNDGEVYSMAHAFFNLARITAAQKDIHGANEILEIMISTLQEMKAPPSAHIIARAYQAFLWVRCGNLEDAAAWLNNTGLHQLKNDEYPDIKGCSFIGIYNVVLAPFNCYIQFIEMTIVHVELALGRYRQALQKVNRLLEQSLQSNNTFHTLQLYLLKTVALYHAEQEGLEETLISAICVAGDEPVCRLFIDGDSAMRTILENTREKMMKLPSQSPENVRNLHLIENILEKIYEDSQQSPPWPAATEQYGITPREIMVLNHLSCGLSYEEIARILMISPNTIKTHINRLYRKLGVRNRLQAVNRAKELGWHKK